MPRIKGTSHAQTIFLRAFRNSPTGPQPTDWPSPAILRRWLRRPTFRQALQSVQETLRLQADFHLTNAATKAAQQVESQHDAFTTQDLTRILRLSHVRQRFTPAPPQPPPDEDSDSDDQDQPQESHCLPLIDHAEEQRARIKIAPLALKLGFHPPLGDHPDFPPPTPQDSFYYKLLHDPHAVLWYMKLYSERFPQDQRFQSLLRHARECIPMQQHLYPRFTDQPDQPNKRWRTSSTLPTPSTPITADADPSTTTDPAAPHPLVPPGKNAS